MIWGSPDYAEFRTVGVGPCPALADDAAAFAEQDARTPQRITVSHAGGYGTTFVVPSTMGLRDAKALLITALENGGFGHEPREVQEERNLLAIGEVTTEFVVKLLQRTLGTDYSSSPHHADASVEVHVFNPTVDQERWYVKAYFSPDESAVFISVHRS